MPMEWSRDKVEFLHRLWLAGESTACIGRSCSKAFQEAVSKNAVVGKAHRMQKIEPGWDSRPSPIKRPAEPTPRALARRVRPADTLPPLPSQKACPSSVMPTPLAHLPSDIRVPAVIPAAVATAPPARTFSGLRCEARDPTQPLKRRDGTGCLYPKGDPGTPGFHYCDQGLVSLNKPYCSEHAWTTTVHRVGERKP